MKRIIAIIVLIIAGYLFFPYMGFGQLYISNVDFSTGQDAWVFVRNDVEYAGGMPQMINHRGKLELQGDWHNSSGSDTLVFATASDGVVEFSGALQSFNGRNTRFPNLTLRGSSKKIQYTSTEVAYTLDLTDRELDVNGFTASVLWNNPDAIVYDEGGYVNTSELTTPRGGTTHVGANSGWLVRNTDDVSRYVYPLGNHGIYGDRFRPLIITASTQGKVYGQFQNYKPDIDGYDIATTALDSIESVNPHWYHALKTDLATNAISLELPYHTAVDGDTYTTMVKWLMNTPQWWSPLASAGPHSTTNYGLDKYFNTTASLILSNNNTVPVSMAIDKAAASLFIPNVITPDNDGVNDAWVVKGMDPQSKYSVVIFNRWNNVVYRSEHYDNKWNGIGLNGGTYFYELRAKSIDGKMKLYKGFITLYK